MQAWRRTAGVLAKQVRWLSNGVDYTTDGLEEQSKQADRFQVEAARDTRYQGNKDVFDVTNDKEAKPVSQQRAVMFLNYKPVPISPGEENLIEVCLREGVYVPKFCYHPNLSVAGNCRMCMVQLAGTQNIIVACATPVMAGMSVLTETRLVATAREGNIEILIINHPLDCPICEQQYTCDLQDITYEYGSKNIRFREDKTASCDKPIDKAIFTSFTKCIHCTRCTRWVQEETKEWSWGMCGRGGGCEITTFIPNKVCYKKGGGGGGGEKGAKCDIKGTQTTTKQTNRSRTTTPTPPRTTRQLSSAPLEL